MAVCSDNANACETALLAYRCWRRQFWRREAASKLVVRLRSRLQTAAQHTAISAVAELDRFLLEDGRHTYAAGQRWLMLQEANAVNGIDVA